MRICIPTTGEGGLEATVFAHFGRAPSFTVIDVDGGDVEVVRNPSCHAHHGTCHHIELLRSRGVDTVICHGLGRRALGGLAEAGIRVLVSNDDSPIRALAAARAGRLRPATLAAACAGSAGHRDGADHGTAAGHSGRTFRR